MNYYKTLIDQKWSFIQSSDDRKEKQLKIALDAKLNNQDKSETDSRRILFISQLYNKYLRLRMQKAFKTCESLEKIYQEIKKITVLFIFYSY